MNISDAPHYKIEDRARILSRVMDSLLRASDCYYPGRVSRNLTADEINNWEARQTIFKLGREFAQKEVQVLDAAPILLIGEANG